MFLITAALVQFYCLYTIWSVAEDIRAGGTGSGFPELLERAIAAKEGNAYAEGLFGTGGVNFEGSKPLNYGSVAAPPVGGGSKFFGGNYHDVDYPPKG